MRLSVVAVMDATMTCAELLMLTLTLLAIAAAPGTHVAAMSLDVLLPSTTPRVARVHRFLPLFLLCPFTSSSFALFYFFPFSFSRSLYLFYSLAHPIPFYQSHHALRFQAGGRRRRSNLGLVCCVNFVLSVLLS